MYFSIFKKRENSLIFIIDYFIFSKILYIINYKNTFTEMKIAGQPSNPQEFIEIQYIIRLLTIKNRINFIVERQKRLEKMLVEEIRK